MYTRQSSAWTIASEIMALGAAAGDTTLDCAYQSNIEDFLSGHGAASTLGGWILAAQEYRHHSSLWAMAFMSCFPNLRNQFPQDVLNDFARACLLDDGCAELLSYTFKGKGILPVDVEDQLRGVQEHVVELLDNSAQFGGLREFY